MLVLWGDGRDCVSYTDVICRRRMHMTIPDFLLILIELFILKIQICACVLAPGSVKLECRDALFSLEYCVYGYCGLG